MRPHNWYMNDTPPPGVSCFGGFDGRTDGWGPQRKLGGFDGRTDGWGLQRGACVVRR